VRVKCSTPCVSGHPEQYPGVLRSARTSLSIDGPTRVRECDYRYYNYYYIIPSVRGSSVPRLRIGVILVPIERAPRFFSAPGIWQRYVIIRRSALPRYLWDREREIERNRNRARAVPSADLSSRNVRRIYEIGTDSQFAAASSTCS